jgi:hypothetical protein
MVKKLSILVILLMPVIALYAFWFHTEKACDLREGHWASNGSYCITRDCYDENSCGNWANPIARCPNLKLGDDISEAYFQLGQPLEIKEGIYTWRAYKIDHKRISVTVKNNKLAEISCNAI